MVTNRMHKNNRKLMGILLSSMPIRMLIRAISIALCFNGHYDLTYAQFLLNKMFTNVHKGNVY